MAVHSMRISGPVNIVASGGDLLELENNQVARITGCFICNDSAGAAVVTLTIRVPGGPDLQFLTASVPAKSTFITSATIVLNEFEVIGARATGAGSALIYVSLFGSLLLGPGPLE